jgi:hypothetical protein
MNTMSAIASAHHFGQAEFDDGQLAEIRVVPGSDALGAEVNDRHLDLEAAIGDRKGFNRSQKGRVPAKRVGAVAHFRLMAPMAPGRVPSRGVNPEARFP